MSTLDMPPPNVEANHGVVFIGTFEFNMILPTIVSR